MAGAKKIRPSKKENAQRPTPTPSRSTLNERNRKQKLTKNNTRSSRGRFDGHMDPGNGLVQERNPNNSKPIIDPKNVDLGMTGWSTTSPKRLREISEALGFKERERVSVVPAWKEPSREGKVLEVKGLRGIVARECVRRKRKGWRGGLVWPIHQPVVEAGSSMVPNGEDEAVVVVMAVILFGVALDKVTSRRMAKKQAKLLKTLERMKERAVMDRRVRRQAEKRKTKVRSQARDRKGAIQELNEEIGECS